MTLYLVKKLVCSKHCGFECAPDGALVEGDSCPWCEEDKEMMGK